MKNMLYIARTMCISFTIIITMIIVIVKTAYLIVVSLVLIFLSLAGEVYWKEVQDQDGFELKNVQR